MYLTLVPVILMLLPIDGDSLRNDGTCESPQYLKLYTKGTINCFFRDFFSVTWYSTSEYSENSPILDYHNMVKNGTGYESGEFDVHPNGSLIIKNVLPYHEVFTVAYKRTKTEVPIFQHIRVIGVVLPVPAFPLVAGCNNQRVCVLEAKPEGNLTCMIRGIRPYVRLEWKAFNKDDDTAIIFTNQQQTSIDNGDTFDVTLTSMYRFRDKFNQKLFVECKVSGSVDAFSSISSKVHLISIKGNQVHSSASVRKIAWALIVTGTLLCMISILSGFLIKKYFHQRRDSETTEYNVMEMTPMLEAQLPIVEDLGPPSASLLNVKKILFIKQLQEQYEDLYGAIKPVPYIKDKFYSVNSVFTEGGIEFLDSMVQGAGRRWVSLKSYKDIFNDSGVKSKRRILESEPGCGKSTLTLQCTYDWCTRSPASVLTDFEILVLLRLSQVGGIKSVYSAIKHTILPRDSPLSEIDVRDIIHECNSLLIIMDEFDKFPDRRKNDSDMNKIIAKQMFRDAEVVITTRTSDLPREYPPGATRVRLTGFNDDARRCYIRKVVTMDNEHDSRNVEEYLKQYPILYDLCQVTSRFVLFAHTKYETHHDEDLNCASSYSSESIVDYLHEFDGKDKLANLCILALTESTENIKGPLSQFFHENIIISGYDELLLQRLYLQLLEIATAKEIPIGLVKLYNCLQSVDLSTQSIKTTSNLALTSRVAVKVLQIDVSNRDMTEDEANDILHFASMCPMLLNLWFHGSVPPRSFKVDSTLATLKSRNVKVMWIMFKDQPVYILNLETGRWKNRSDESEPTATAFEKMHEKFRAHVGLATDTHFKGEVQKIRERFRILAEKQQDTAK